MMKNWSHRASFKKLTGVRRNASQKAISVCSCVQVAALLLLLALSNAVVNATIGQVVGNIVGICDNKSTILNPRPHSVSITEFGAVGDGKSLNTIAFQNAIFYLKSFADKGGAQLYVPSGRWLTGSFNLTSHLTLFLEKGAVILGSQDPSNWEIVEPLPSYGRGIELPGRRYRSLINGYMLHDVVITGDNGTIEGQGFVWWDWYNTNKLNYSRPHLIEFISSKFIVISNLTLLNSPAYSIHHVYCSDVHIQNILVFTPPDSPQTIGIVPDSSNNVCIEDCRIITGYDSIALKSGWDEYGIAYGVPTANVQIQHVHLQSSTGSCLAFGSEMSGGIRDIHVQSVRIDSSSIGVSFRTTKGRGGYIKDIFISDLDMEGVFLAFEASGQCGTHPDDSYDPFALPEIDRISIQNVIGRNISVAGKFTGIPESPFSCIFLSNISLSLTNPTSLSPWTCSDVSGCSSSVFPAPCPDLEKEEPLLLTSSSGGLLIQSRLSSYSVI